MIGYIQGKDLYNKLNADDLKDEDMYKYYITINNYVYITRIIARKLHMPLDKLIEILNLSGAVENNGGNLCFKNKDDATKAVIMLNMIK